MGDYFHTLKDDDDAAFARSGIQKHGPFSCCSYWENKCRLLFSGTNCTWIFYVIQDEFVSEAEWLLNPRIASLQNQGKENKGKKKRGAKVINIGTRESKPGQRPMIASFFLSLPPFLFFLLSLFPLSYATPFRMDSQLASPATSMYDGQKQMGS